MAMQTFVLVEWLGDDKPECWQVIKTADAFPRVNTGEIREGTVLDGIWKEDEETSPAKILKVNGKDDNLLLYEIVCFKTIVYLILNCEVHPFVSFCF